jgi:hypothetical protein
MQTMILCVLQGSMFANDRVVLEHIRNKIDENYTGFYSWSGIADVQITVNDSKPPERFPKKQLRKYEYDYVFDKRTDNFLSLAKLKEEYTIYGNKKIHLLISNDSYMKKDEICYRFSWRHNRNVETKTFKDNDFVATKYYELLREAFILAEPLDTRDTPNIFDPFLKCCYSDDSLNSFRNIIKMMHKKSIINLNEFESNDGETIQLTQRDRKYILTLYFGKRFRESRIYTFDTEQGYNLVSYSREQKEKTSEKIVTKKNWSCQYEKIGTHWVPQSTMIEDYNNSSDSSGIETKEVIHWKSHEINTAIPDSAFTLQKLGLCRGDRLYDQRTEQTEIISGDDFPPPFITDKNSHVEDYKRFTIINYLLCGLGAFLVLLSIAIKIYKWKKK